MTEPQDELSAPGRQRRDAILRLAVQAARGRRRRRLAVRGAAVACGSALAAGVAFQMASKWGLAPTTNAPVELTAVLPSPVPTPRVETPPDTLRVAHIATDPTIAERLAVTPAAPAWSSIDDDELLASLAQDGKSAGLIETGGRTLLLSQTDFRNPLP
jgi:hypothetical protein